MGGNGFIAAFVGGLTLGNTARNVCGSLYKFGEAEGQLLTLFVFFLFGGTYPENLMESETGGVYCVSPAGGSEIFADGFESGDTSAWTLTVP